MPKDTNLLPEFALLGMLALLWGSSYVFIKIALIDIPPLTLIAIRVSIAAVLLGLAALLLGHRLPRGRERWTRLMLQAFLNSIGAWTILAWGQQHVDAALASVLNSTSPIFAVVFTLAVAGRGAVPFRQIVGTGIGILGVVLVVGADALDGVGNSLAGQAACLIGAALYAMAAVHGQRFGDLSPVVTATATMTCATAVLVPVALAVDRPWTLAPGPGPLGAALALGALSTALAMAIYFRLVKTLGSVGVASQSYLRAGVGVLLGVAFLGEVVIFEVGLGVATAILGVVLINLPRVPRRNTRRGPEAPLRRNRETP